MKLRNVGALVLVIGTTICWLTWGDARIEAHGGLIIAGYAAACLLVLPIEIGLFIAVLLVGVFLSLEKINETKITLVKMPLTFVDIKIAAANPDGLVNALGVKPWILHLAYLVFAGVAAAGIILAVRVTRKRFTRGVPIVRAIIGAAIFSFSAVLLLQFEWGLNTRVVNIIKREDVSWTPDGVSMLSKRVGILPFLLYSYHIESANPAASFSSNIAPPGPNEISDAVSTYVHPKHNELAPNIVVIQAESTFDPNKTFNLSAPVGGSLVSIHPDTQALGQLRVNTVGAGTWITEFETITGVDSRFFGYSGYYTHAAVSPYIKQSLATYLSRRGYRTAGFYATRGNFYNARNAYKSYGFQNFYDSLDLGHLPDDWAWTDSAFMKGVIKKLGENPEAPFYAQVVSTENHAPHPCVNFSSKNDFIATLAGTEDFGLNCGLNEYLLRLRSTDEAFDTIIEYLRELQTRTGRPYVVLMYGDHQPWTFTNAPLGTPGAYWPYRTGASLNETVFQLVSSMPNRVTCCDKALPGTLIPSIVSAFAAATPEDVYLGINFYLYAQCGPSAFQTAKLHGLYGKEAAWGVTDAKGEVVTPACEKAREQAFGAYRQQGIF